MCWKIIFSGYIEVTETLIIKDEKHLEDFQGAIDEGMIQMHEWLQSEVKHDSEKGS